MSSVKFAMYQLARQQTSPSPPATCPARSPRSFRAARRPLVGAPGNQLPSNWWFGLVVSRWGGSFQFALNKNQGFKPQTANPNQKRGTLQAPALQLFIAPIHIPTGTNCSSQCSLNKKEPFIKPAQFFSMIQQTPRRHLEMG